MSRKTTNKQIPQKQGKVGYKNPPKETQFKTGQSGNPGGLPKGTPKVSIALMKLLAGKDIDKYEPVTRAERLAWSLYTKASVGDVQALKEVMDRLEGKTPSTIHVDRDDARAARYQKLVDELAAKYNKPRDQVVADVIEMEPEAAGWLM